MGVLLISAIYLWLFWQDTEHSAPPLPDVSVFVGSDEPIRPLPLELPNLDKRKVALGKMLFNDVRMSKDNSIACVNCHQLEHAGVDHLKYPVGFHGQVGDINAPTVFNSGFNFRQFWNGRAASLEEQISGPIHVLREMASNWDEVVFKLQKDASYLRLFKAIYKDGVTVKNIADAVATFERSLITPNSRFDRFLRGDEHAITSEELAGYKLFKSYGCISCHQGMNIGGNMYEKLGIMNDYFGSRGDINEADMGRYSVTKIAEQMHEFKVPSLRNVDRTAPYFHDGSASTLSAAVIIMAKYQLGLDMPAEDVSKIVAFLKTLTGEYEGRPL
jgi:cytochrome c peroxidase